MRGRGRASMESRFCDSRACFVPPQVISPVDRHSSFCLFISNWRIWSLVLSNLWHRRGTSQTCHTLCSHMLFHWPSGQFGEMGTAVPLGLLQREATGLVKGSTPGHLVQKKQRAGKNTQLTLNLPHCLASWACAVIGKKPRQGQTYH